MIPIAHELSDDHYSVIVKKDLSNDLLANTPMYVQFSHTLAFKTNMNSKEYELMFIDFRLTQIAQTENMMQTMRKAVTQH